MASRKEVPSRGKSEDEDKPESKISSKKGQAKRETAKNNRQKHIEENMEEMESRAMRLRISDQSLGTLRAGPPDPKEAGSEYIVQWDNDAASRLRISPPRSGHISFGHNPTYAQLSGRMGCKMDAIAEEVRAGTVTIRQRAISARKKDHSPKYQRKKK
jgi:hypothetical protein